MERRRIEIWVDAPGYTTDHVLELMRKELEDAAWDVFRKFIPKQQGGFVQANEGTTTDADPKLEALLASEEAQAAVPPSGYCMCGEVIVVKDGSRTQLNGVSHSYGSLCYPCDLMGNPLPRQSSTERR